jgi:polysaccharide deacetylase family protein (PEP-CTERM system associated)
MTDPRVIPTQQARAPLAGHAAGPAPLVVLSFDVEEHHRIEAASHLAVPDEKKSYYRGRMEDATRWILEALASRDIRATFYIVGELARLSRALVREIADAGHEVGSHGWDHRRVSLMTPDELRRDATDSKDALEQATGRPVLGYRAPTFSIMKANGWALEVLAEAGYRYDSSIYPVRHDRYGVPDAPLVPFVVNTKAGPIIELPPLTLRVGWLHLPVGGGGYFRIFPNWMMRWGIRQMARSGADAPAMLYFHPWEFDEGQERLPLGLFSRWRTYSGIKGGRQRLCRLMDGGYRFSTAHEVVRSLSVPDLPVFHGLAAG